MPGPKIVLFGNETGIDEVAERLGVKHVSEIATNSRGTPLVSDMFRQADPLAEGDVLAFVNADIILTQSVVEAAAIASRWSEEFLLVARRHDVDIRDPVDFDRDWPERLNALLKSGTLHSEGGIDLFMYRRGQFAEMPPFAIGRSAYDNWLLWSTVASGIPLIDGTEYATLLHQNHDYSHAPNVDVWYGPEARENKRWMGHWTRYYTIHHANWKMDREGRITPATELRYRMARPRRAVSQAFRALHPLRDRIYVWRHPRRFEP